MTREPADGAQPGVTPLMHAQIQSRRHPGARVGPERMALLQAIRELGSIRAAAVRAGLSYTGAGGAAVVTPAGDAVLAAFS